MIFFITISFIFLSIFWLYSGLTISLKKNKNKNRFSERQIGISVIIAAKNEYQNIKKNIDFWLNLDYKNYEVILVINNSTDESLNYVQNIKNQKLKVIYLENTPNDWSPKKYALTKGILSSDNEYIVFTDADCKPVSNQWLKYYNQAFLNGKEIVIGLSPYITTQKGILSLLIQWETFFTAYLYTFTAILQKPYMCVGRNWGLKKEVFFQEKGFEKHKNILGGDDDLFIQNLEKNYLIEVLLEPNSQTISEPKNHFNDYIIQKKRHYSASKYYKFKSKFLLFILNFMQFINLFWILHVNYILKNENLLLILCLMKLFKFTAIQIFAHKTDFKISALNKLLGEYLLVLFQIVILPYSFFQNNRWK